MKKNNKNNNRPKQTMSKRWFVGVSGWGLTLNAGSGIHDQGLKKRQIPISIDSKVYFSGGIVTAANFLHNTIYTCNLTAPISQGPSDQNRIGDFINIESAALHLRFETANATVVTATVNVRVMLVASTFQSATANFTSGLGSTNLFLAASGGQINQFIDPKLCKTLCDEIYTLRPCVTTGSSTFTHTECVVKAPFEYQTNKVYGTAANLYWVVIPDCTGGSTGVTLCGALTWDQAITFRDV